MTLHPFLDLHPWEMPSWAEVDLKAIRHNFQEIKRLAGKTTRILCVVKGDAYGHGLVRVASFLDQLGLEFFGVSDIEEGMILRKNGIRKPILIFESTLPSQAQRIVEYHLTPTICTMGMAKALNRYAKSLPQRLGIHVEVDTGMGRFGIGHEEAFDFIKNLSLLSHLSIQGIYTHFPLAETDREFTRRQIRHLYDLVKRLDQSGVVVPTIHAANSMGLVGYKTRILNLARPGLMLYGLSPSVGAGLKPVPTLKRKIALRPALSVKSRIVFLKKVKKGQGISYGHTFVAPKNMEIATLAIGYKDGYLRCLSNKSCVLIRGWRCPVVGRVTMDQIMVDVSGIKPVRVGMEAVILGKQKDASIDADELAEYAHTISYEIVCHLGNHLPRVYKT